MNPTTDERAGKPSASGIERIALCPGSWNLERGQPEGPPSEDAERGNIVHALLAGDGMANVGATDEDREIAETCKKLTYQLFIDHLGCRPEDAAILIREERLWLGDRSLSGKPDVVGISITHNDALVIDYKTGRNEVETAIGNLQLRALAVLVDDNYTVERVVVAIIQPWVSPQTSVCEYDRDALDQAKAELLTLLRWARVPDAPRVPGEKQCRYCRAKSVCPEFLATMPTLATALPLPHGADGESVARLINLLPADRLAQLLDAAPLAELVIDTVRTEAKRRLAEDPAALPGWSLKPGAMREKITDVSTVFERAARLGATPEQFAQACSVTKKDLKDLLKSVTKGKALDAVLTETIAGCTEAKQTAPSLERV